MSDTAIEALRYSEFPNNSDTISRQAAIDALDGELEITGRTNAEAVKGYVRLVKDRLERLPSAQPDVPDMNVGGMISRQAAMEKLMVQNVIMDGSEYHNGFNAGVNRAQEVIRNLPSVQPKRGKWIERESDTEDKENGFETVIVCSRCDYPATTFYSEDCESRTQIRTAFCPTCGADMRGNEDCTD